MITTLPTQEQVDRIARELAPDVVHIRMDVGHDWSDHPAIYFRVILSDEASRRDRLRDVTERVREKVSSELGLDALEHLPYFRFRSQSEQANLHEPRTYCNRRITLLRMKVPTLVKQACGARYQLLTTHSFIC